MLQTTMAWQTADGVISRFNPGTEINWLTDGGFWESDNGMKCGMTSEYGWKLQEWLEPYGEAEREAMVERLRGVL